MKRLIIVLSILVLALTACGSDEVYQRAYTANGDGTNETELTRTTTFQKNADINVVIKLGSHDSDVEVKATFYAQNNQIGDALTATAGEGVGTVVLGLDWEARPDQELWPEGAWEAVITVDGEEVETLDFTVG